MLTIFCCRKDTTSILAPVEVTQTVQDSLSDVRIWQMFDASLWILFAVVLIAPQLLKLTARRIGSDVQNFIFVCQTFTLVILFGIYRGRLMASLMKPTTVVQYDSLEQLIDGLNNGRINLAVTSAAGVWYIDELDEEKSDNPHFHKLYAALKNNPIVPLKNEFETNMLVSEGKAISIHSYVYGTYAAQRFCNVQVIFENRLFLHA